jgi:threonine aldolase
MCLIAAPWAALLESGAWLRNAEHVNGMARRLERELREVAGLRLVYPVQANAVSVQMPEHWAETLHARGWHFYTVAGAERLMCSWDTQEADIEALMTDLRVVATGA